jgi:YHS domain-containing protein
VLLRTFLLFLVVLLVVRALWRLMSGVVQGASGPAGRAGAPSRPASPPAVKMMRDPICGTYVVPGKALELARGRETLYFCSEKCRDQYFQKS